MKNHKIVLPDLKLEKALWKQGLINVAGVDEAGKGPWAGPVTAGAIVIHSEKQIVGLVRDSKLMTANQREKAFPLICKKSSAFGIGVVSHIEIDMYGIDSAVKKAMMIALSEIEINFNLTISFVLIDGSKTKPLSGYKNKRIKKGGLFHYSIAAGSVLAKVTRDRIMKKYAKQYPVYGFERNKGYGTENHQKALRMYGFCPLHRKSFQPIKSML